MADSPVDEGTPKKPRGWPKGKLRGPRKVKDVQPPAPAPVAPPSPVQTPNPAPVQPTYQEPIIVRGTLNSGKNFELGCTVFERVNGSWHFVSYPPIRGYKTFTEVHVSELAAISITAPEQALAQGLRPVVTAPPQTVAPQPVIPPSHGSGSLPPVQPQMYVNPLGAQVRDVNATQAERVPHPALPMSKITHGEDGKESVIGARMS